MLTMLRRRVYIVDNLILFGEEGKSTDTNPLQRNRVAENGAGNDIANMVPEPRGRGAWALRFRRVRPLAREAVDVRRRCGLRGNATGGPRGMPEDPQLLRHSNMRNKVVPRSHGLSSLCKMRVLLRVKREFFRRQDRERTKFAAEEPSARTPSELCSRGYANAERTYTERALLARLCRQILYREVPNELQTHSFGTAETCG